MTDKPLSESLDEMEQDTAEDAERGMNDYSARGQLRLIRALKRVLAVETATGNNTNHPIGPQRAAGLIEGWNMCRGLVREAIDQEDA